MATQARDYTEFDKNLKSAGVDVVQRSLNAGGSVVAMATSFYSGGYLSTAGCLAV